MNLKVFLLIILHEIVGAAEQVFFKKGVKNLQINNFFRFKDYLIFFKGVLSSPLIWLGFIMTVLMWWIWLMVLASLKLSVAIPLSSIHYLIIFTAAHFILKEHIDKTRLAGALLILVGVILVLIRY